MLSRKKLRDEIIDIIDEMVDCHVSVDTYLDDLEIYLENLTAKLEDRYDIAICICCVNWDTVQDVITGVGNALIEQGHKFNEAEEEI